MQESVGCRLGDEAGPGGAALRAAEQLTELRAGSVPGACERTRAF